MFWSGGSRAVLFLHGWVHMVLKCVPGETVMINKFPTETVWNQRDTEQLAILGSRPSKANTCGLN